MKNEQKATIDLSLHEANVLIDLLKLSAGSGELKEELLVDALSKIKHKIAIAQQVFLEHLKDLQ